MLTYAQARARLTTMLAGEPALSTAEIDDLMRIAIDEPLATFWRPNMGYAAGTRMQPSVENGHAYAAQTDGVSGNTEPNWPTTEGGTVVDGTITWKEVPGEFDLNAAAATGWGWKASKIAEQVNISAGGASIQKDQRFQHATQMQQLYQAQAGPMMVRVTRSDVV